MGANGALSSKRAGGIFNLRICVMPKRSFILRSRRPPRRLPLASGGIGSERTSLGGGGSWVFNAAQ